MSPKIKKKRKVVISQKKVQKSVPKKLLSRGNNRSRGKPRSKVARMSVRYNKKLRRAAKKRITKKPLRVTRTKSRTVKPKKPGLFKKIEENPIISPRPEHEWEAWQTFNPTAILLDGRVHFLYRAIGTDGISRLGYAVSRDGFTIDERGLYPVFEHASKQRSFNIYSYFSGGSWGGAEDPRIVRVDGEDDLYMTYTACDQGELRVGLTSITVHNFLQRKWKWKTPALISMPGEVHKNWVIFPEKMRNQYAILHSINPEISVATVDSLAFDTAAYIKSFHGGSPQKGCWDTWVRGAGPPPIRTKDGWLLFYHAMDNDWGKYKIGAMLLDLENPTIILHRSKEPVLEPDQQYENNGFKGGVIYASGAVVKEGNLLVYYGSADNYICVAYANLNEFLEALRKEQTPKLKGRAVRKNN